MSMSSVVMCAMVVSVCHGCMSGVIVCARLTIYNEFEFGCVVCYGCECVSRVYEWGDCVCKAYYMQ